MVFYWILIYFTFDHEPDTFKNAVELLQNNKSIIEKIGDYKSYSYYAYDLPGEKDNPANIKVSLIGSRAAIYISCKIRKDSAGDFHFIQIHQDSLVKSKI